MHKFSYLAPKTIQEAISMYFENPDKKTVYMAGGTDILLKIKNSEIIPERVISLSHIKEHTNIRIDNNLHDLVIGGFVTHRKLENSRIIAQKYPILRDAVQNIGSVQIRNIATIGGNLVNAVPSADGAIPLMALGASVRLKGKNGKRTINLKDFFLGPGKTLLKPGEILTDIIIPKIDKYTSGAYKKFGRRNAMELPIIGVGIVMSLETNSEYCKKVRISLGVAAPTPMRALKAEKILEGKKITENLLTKAGNTAAKESQVRDTLRGKAWHRKKLISVYIRRLGLLTIKRIKSSNSTA